jgi:hypothetical protein
MGLHAKRRTLGDAVITLLRGKEELGQGKHITEALELVSQEADMRICTQFEILGGSDSSVELTGYSYSSFFAVYRFLLAKAIYHRYWAEANSTWTTFMFPKEPLAHEIAHNTEREIPMVGPRASRSFLLKEPRRTATNVFWHYRSPRLA